MRSPEEHQYYSWSSLEFIAEFNSESGWLTFDVYVPFEWLFSSAIYDVHVTEDYLAVCITPLNVVFSRPESMSEINRIMRIHRVTDRWSVFTHWRTEVGIACHILL